jgi:diguanylate cyclase (GGDEF)-like protein
VLVVDLDHFAAVNDTLGRDAGDEVLRVIAERFVANVRTDAGDLVCRVGGDEIAVVLRNTTEGVARATADRLIEAARQPIPAGGEADARSGLLPSPAVVHIGATVGISQSNPARHSPDTTLRHAHLAMYQAKESGRGGYVVFNGAAVRRQHA